MNIKRVFSYLAENYNLTRKELRNAVLLSIKAANLREQASTSIDAQQNYNRVVDRLEKIVGSKQKTMKQVMGLV